MSAMTSETYDSIPRALVQSEVGLTVGTMVGDRRASGVAPRTLMG